MGAITGERAVDIAAPAQRCFEIAADLEGSVRWQSSLRDVDVLERDAAGLPALATLAFDAKVRTISSRCRLAYAAHASITWEQEHGDVKAMRGRWSFSELGDGMTRATYALEVDPGRMLGMLLRGGAEASVRNHLLTSAAEGLKREAEAG